MSVCPVCKNNHQQEVSKCQRCNWSMKDDLGIDSDHEILTICIPAILRSLESKAAENKQLQSMIQKIELQEADSSKLDEILDELETDRKQTHKHFEKLSEIITELKTSLSEVKNEFSNIPTKAQEKILAMQNISASAESPLESNQRSKENIAIKDSNSELLGQTDCQQSNLVSSPSFVIDRKHHDGSGNQGFGNISNSFSLASNDRKSSLYERVEEKDRNPDHSFESINESQSSLYDNQSDRQIVETVTPQENNSKKTANSNNSYQSFYRLIKRGELDFTVVTIPQETIEKARSGTQSELNFAEDKKGNYWIVNWHDVYCLIPKEKNIINQYQYANFQRAFNCEGYYEEYSNLEVVEPAIVSNYDDKNWRLERKGKIKFI